MVYRLTEVRLYAQTGVVLRLDDSEQICLDLLSGLSEAFQSVGARAKVSFSRFGAGLGLRFGLYNALLGS